MLNVVVMSSAIIAAQLIAIQKKTINNQMIVAMSTSIDAFII